MTCPFCNSGIKPSPGLTGVYQHAENVETCIIGDLAIKDVAAWNRRSSSSREEVRREAMEEAAKVADQMAVNRRRVSYAAAHACEYIAARLRALSQGE
jgi:hypothetical protein